MGKTGISWTGKTWNCVKGCSRVSAGCQHCYAEIQAARIVRMGKGKPTAYDGLVKLVTRDVRQFKMVAGEPTGDFRTVSRTEPRWTGKVVIDAKALALPLRWRKPERIFVNSMSDLFHESLTNEQIAAVFGVMAACPQHTFQVLTKRARRMREWFEWAGRLHMPEVAMMNVALRVLPEGVRLRVYSPTDGSGWPLPNVWLGVSVENQEAADERIPELLRTPAAVRFLSCEPLLGQVNLRGIGDTCADALCSATGIDQVIAGCESGPGARPCSVEWLRSLRDQTSAAGVAFFLKQAVEQLSHSTSAAAHPIAAGAGSKRKPGGVIELPYLDGVQWAQFPEVPR